MDNSIYLSGHLPLTRRCFFTAAGLAVAAPSAGAGESPTVTENLPIAALLADAGVKTYLLEFRTGQEVMQGLLAFAKKHKLVAGHLTGIGAISEAVIGYFDPEKKIYLRNPEKGQAEVLSLTGNLALYNNEPFFHIHVALGLRDGSARGGHLFEAIVRPTVEVVLTAYPKPVRRKVDPETGLPLLDP
jgi:predicted DNA-binding protein with PD1-like motif